jgi:predicted DNA-binding transcriptional regulator AlpA
MLDHAGYTDRAAENDTLPVFVTAEIVASLIGMASSAAFLVKREALEKRHGFPLPMPCQTRPYRWRTKEVLAWVERQGRPGETPIPSGSNIERLRRKAQTA